jgi:hypothetical protein
MSQDNQTSIPQAPQASRRALLFGIAAVGAVASPAVAATLLEAPKAPAIVEAAVASPADVAIPSPDAALLQLFDEYMATEYWRLAVKAQVAAIEGEEDTQFADTTLESILRDMRAMSRRARA